MIRASGTTGLFYGTQTLLQMLPSEVFAPRPPDGIRWTIPCIAIEDAPRFGWRGMLLDVGRHMIAVDDLKRLLDVMALHKLNTFHWHLTEDQGWRIEIKKYPRLTEIGAWRDSSPLYGNRTGSDGQRYGGFYTQEQIKDIVAYAAARHITVVPEIELPGHSAAALAAYPQFGNDDIPNYAPRVASLWGVQPYIYAPKEETFRFLEDVLAEVCALFPSKFIHIGGDEAPKTQWKASKFAQEVIRREGLKNEEELQGWFIRRIGRFLESKNRRLVGWDEINEGGLPKSATMMVWRDTKWAKHALALGNDIVMTPLSHTYFDYVQAPAALELAKGVEFEARAALLSLAKAYSYNPSSVAETAAQEKQILGTQAQIWGEFTKDIKKVEYLAFPRVLALAEIAWTPQAARDFDDFSRRLHSAGLSRLEQLGINFYRETASQIGGWVPGQISVATGQLEWPVTKQISSAGKFRVCLVHLDGASAVKIRSVALFEDGREVSRDTHDCTIGRRSRDAVFVLDVPSPTPHARYTLRAELSSEGDPDANGAVYWDTIPVEVPR